MASKDDLRPLVPLPQRPPPATAAGSADGAKRALKSRSGARVLAACQACKKRKSKCDGARPACRGCTLHSSECLYATSTPSETRGEAMKRKFDETQDRKSQYEELFELLKSLPEPESVKILKRIRDGEDVASLVSHIRDGNLLLQLALAPETRRQYEFPYRTRIPSFLLSPGNPYLTSQLVEIPSLDAGLLVADGARLRPSTSIPYTVPFGAVQLAEPILDRITASTWTWITTDSALVRRLLGVYFLHIYPIFPFFQKDLFLEDMAKGNTRFCSRLLVHAVLAAASHGYEGFPNRSKHWLPDDLGYRFLAEARRLWDVEQDSATLTAIQASAVMQVVINLNAMDQVGMRYFEHALSKAREIDLFKRCPQIKSEKMKLARAFAAWTLYARQAMLSFNFLKPPWILEPPEMPIPDPKSNPGFYGEIWLRYPTSQTIYQYNLGHCLKSTMFPRVLMARIAGKTSESSAAPLSIAESVTIKRELDAWYTCLPDCQAPQNLVFPGHFHRHLEYFQILIGLFKLHLGGKGPEYSGAWGNPQQIISLSKICLESLLRVYYLRHGFEPLDVTVILFIVTLGNWVLDDLLKAAAISKAAAAAAAAGVQAAAAAPSEASLEDSRATLIFCARWLQAQGAHVVIANLIFCTLRDRAAPGDRTLIAARTTSPDLAEIQLAIRQSQAAWPMPFIKGQAEGGGASDPSAPSKAGPSNVLRQNARANEARELEVRGGDGGSGSSVSPTPEPEKA